MNNSLSVGAGGGSTVVLCLLLGHQERCTPRSLSRSLSFSPSLFLRFSLFLSLYLPFSLHPSLPPSHRPSLLPSLSPSLTRSRSISPLYLSRCFPLSISRSPSSSRAMPPSSSLHLYVSMCLSLSILFQKRCELQSHPDSLSAPHIAPRTGSTAELVICVGDSHSPSRSALYIYFSLSLSLYIYIYGSFSLSIHLSGPLPLPISVSAPHMAVRTGSTAESVICVGDSAGANLAMVVALRALEEGTPPPPHSGLQREFRG